MTQFVDDLVDRLRGRLDGRGAGRATEAPVASAIALVEIQIHEGNIFVLDVLPDIDLGPIQQRMDANMGAGRESRLELIPEFGRLIAEVPVAMLIAGRKIPLLRSRPLFVRSHTENNTGVPLLLDQLFQSVRLEGGATGDTTHRMVHARRQGFFVLPHH